MEDLLVDANGVSATIPCENIGRDETVQFVSFSVIASDPTPFGRDMADSEDGNAFSLFLLGCGIGYDKTLAEFTA
ncbi:hypothetical protein HZH68_012624 [Vespula germanica]|uniref:Uncharacterized protein n=1 Tax=Vespula germanica TaxID=30212 RepID=A0A834MXF2_VESGE|nr:hypothetical protein HZH68_012624 [Vespula germanica]